MLAESLAAEDEMPSGNCSESFGSETNGPKSFGFGKLFIVLQISVCLNF